MPSGGYNYSVSGKEIEHIKSEISVTPGVSPGETSNTPALSHPPASLKAITLHATKPDY